VEAEMTLRDRIIDCIPQFITDNLFSAFIVLYLLAIFANGAFIGGIITYLIFVGISY
jgi:hypothetical protein